MKGLCSVFLILTMLVGKHFYGISDKPLDLLSTGEPEEITLSVKQAELLTRIFETETSWLASLQLENGAIPMTKNNNGTVTMNPYFADFAAMALLDDAEKYADNVKAYMEWHFSHLNTKKTDYNKLDATIYDYEITLENGKIVKPVKGASLIGNGADTLLKIDAVADNLSRAQGMCGSSSGSIPTDVGQPAIRVSSMIVGGRG